MIRVLQVVDRLKRVSGIARSILNYYEHIDTDKVQFDFLVVDCDKDIVENIKQRGGNVFKIEKLGLTNGGKVKREIEQFFLAHKKQYPIVHSSFYHIDFILFPVAKKYGTSVCISHSHNTQYSDYWLRSWRNAVLAKLSLKYATHFIACSTKAAAFQFGKKRVESGDVFILKNAIDAQAYEFNAETRECVREKLGLKGNYVIGNVGRFNRQKNHKFLLKIFSEYVQSDKSAVLLLVGEGELMDQFKKEAKERGLSEKVVFLGARNDVPNLLQAMDCYVFPSLYEGLGISLVEAQAAGLPCVASLTIPEESRVTDNISYLAFTDASSWKAEIWKYKKFERSNTIQDIIKAGYDIRSAARTLENYYESLH